MKSFALIVAATLMLGGCASWDSTYYVDRELGQAVRFDTDLQVAYPDYRYAAKTPEKIPGIIAEDVMDVYEQTFKESPKKVNVFQLGLTQ
jgi:hypothetical protein